MDTGHWSGDVSSWHHVIVSEYVNTGVTLDNIYICHQYASVISSSVIYLHMYLSTNTIVMILYLLTDCYGGDGGAMAEMFALTLIV